MRLRPLKVAEPVGWGVWREIELSEEGLDAFWSPWSVRRACFREAGRDGNDLMHAFHLCMSGKIQYVCEKEDFLTCIQARWDGWFAPVVVHVEHRLVYPYISKFGVCLV